MTQKRLLAYADVVCDLFHPGHIAFFRQCRALADGLIVGIHSDADVATYKRRPVMTLEERVAMVQACSLVDHVVPGAPLETTASFLDAIGAAFVCHGDDIDSAQQADAYGALIAQNRVRLVRYTPTISTTLLLHRLGERGLLSSDPHAR